MCNQKVTYAGVVHRLVRQPSKLDRWVRFPSPAPFYLILGCRQAVRHQTLTLAFVGSNPAIPAKSFLSKFNMRG